MTEVQPHPDRPQRTSPPRLTPSPDAIDGATEFKLPRKREREVSLEPVTPAAGTDTPDPLLRERKDSRTPLKKNRRVLDTTVEATEEDGAGQAAAEAVPRSRSGSGSPPAMAVVASPRQEMKLKVRQISRGVEDISWKGVAHQHTGGSSSDQDKDVDIQDVSQSVGATLEPAADIEPSSAEGPNGTSHAKMDEDIHSGEASPTLDDDVPVNVADNSLPTELPSNADGPPRRNSIEESNGRLRADSETLEKAGVKRKFLERGTSAGPSENGDAPSPDKPTEPTKRPRDEADKDDNPRETKRPSPPPSPPLKTPPSPQSSKPPAARGFMAYASATSPFASVKGQNIFSSKSSSPSFSVPSTPMTVPATPSSVASSPFVSATPTSTPAPAAKSSGFAAFASTSSPFSAFARSKSPVLGSTSKLGRAKSPPRSRSVLSSNPFASYAGPSQGFALPAQKRARASSQDGSQHSSVERTSTATTPVVSVFGEKSEQASDNEGDGDQEEEQTFGERLRAAGDDEQDEEADAKVKLTEQEVATGEEEEETLHQVRGKLFSLDGNSWKERGTGLLKLNVNAEDGTAARLVMRKDAVYTLLLNITLFPGMRCSLAQDPRYLRFSAIENGVATTYNLKVSNAKIAADLLEDINANIPAS